MTPWEVIEQALVRRNPPRTKAWLAEQLEESSATLTNWKNRGVPARKYRVIAEKLGLSLDQLEGLEPLPWATEIAWPFSAKLQERVALLTSEQAAELEAQIWALLEPKELAVEGKVKDPTHLRVLQQSAARLPQRKARK